MEIIKNNLMTISHYRMRKLIGLLGMFLPWILLISNNIINSFDLLNKPQYISFCCGFSGTQYISNQSFKTSISHYYYTAVGELFTGILIVVAIFMFTYRGHKLRKRDFGLSDNLMTNMAGFFALIVVIFPTSPNNDKIITDNVRCYTSTDFIDKIHLTSAGLFFITLAFMSIINFRRGEIIDKFEKKDFYRNLYKYCGIIMLVSIALIVIYSFLLKNKYSNLDAIHPVFILESIALFAFGLSWIVKGRIDCNPVYIKIKSYSIKMLNLK